MAKKTHKQLGEACVSNLRKVIDYGFSGLFKANTQKDVSNLKGAIWFAICVAGNGVEEACKLFDVDDEVSRGYYSSKMFRRKAKELVGQILYEPLTCSVLEVHEGVQVLMGMEHIDWDSEYLANLRASFDPAVPPNVLATEDMKADSEKAIEIWERVINVTAVVIKKDCSGKVDVEDAKKCLWRNVKVASETGDHNILSSVVSLVKIALDASPGVISKQEFEDMSPTLIHWTDDHDAKFLHQNDDEFFNAAMKMASNSNNCKIGSFDMYSGDIQMLTGQGVAEA